jgi:hypothetical protein
LKEWVPLELVCIFKNIFDIIIILFLGPVRSFPDKKNYKPQIEIAYADEKGRLLDSKEAFRVLSWKFHGKAPGKKQVEKRRAKFEKKERLKKMVIYIFTLMPYFTTPMT